VGVGRSVQIRQPFSNLTVFENLVMAAGYGSGLSARAVTALRADVLERCALIDRANQTAGSLILLGRKRLELARAMAAQPKLLVLD
jgi:branched-chain amino acid transport system ATP-binding protein